MKEQSKREVVRALNRAGCRKLRDKGDHEVWECPCGDHRTPVPRHRTISAGVIRQMIKHLSCLPKGWLS